MGSVLAFEGPDLAGKSSLISRLRDREPWSLWPMLRMDVPPALLRDPLHREWEVLSRAWNLGLVGFKRHMSFLLDRCYVSSLVYSRVYGRKADLSYIEKVEEELQPTIVYVHTPIEVLLRRFEAEGDRTLHSQRVLIAVAKAYDDWYDAVEKRQFPTVVAVDGTAPFEDSVEAIVSELS